MHGLSVHFFWMKISYAIEMLFYPGGPILFHRYMLDRSHHTVRALGSKRSLAIRRLDGIFLILQHTDCSSEV